MTKLAPQTSNISTSVGRRVDVVLGTLGIVLLLLHAVVVTHQSVDLPLNDEWEYFLPGALGHDLNIRWLFAPHNEHRIVFTKLLAWILLRTADLNFVTNTMVNLVLWAVICVLVLRLVKRGSSAPLGIILIVFSSMVLREIHGWPFLSQFHFYALFFVLGLTVVRSEGARSWLVVPCAAASAYSFSAGVFCGVALGGAAVLMAWLRPGERLRRITQGVLCWAAVATWALGHGQAGSPSEIVSPKHAAFWEHFLGTFASGIGVDVFSSPTSTDLLVGAAFFMLIGTLVYRELRAVLMRLSSAEAAAIRVAYVGALLLGICATSLARAKFGTANGIPPRYNYPVVLLFPVVWAMGV